MQPITVSFPTPTQAQVDALTQAGPGAVIHCPRVRTPAGRKQLAGALGRAGLKPELVRSLGYSTKGPPPVAADPEKPPKPEAADLELAEPGDPTKQWPSFAE